MATVPNPKSWSPATVPTATEFNTDIRDAINFFKSPPRAQVKNNANIDLVTQTWTVLTWNQEDADTDGIHSTGSNTSRLVAATAGRYFVTINLRWEEHGGGQNGARGTQIRKNAAGSAASGSCVSVDMRHAQTNVIGAISSANHGTSGYVFLNASDYVEAFAYHSQDVFLSGTDNSEVEMTLTAAVRFGMIWVSSL